MSSCSCIKGDFDFKIESLDRESIIFRDLSEWMEEENYVIPSTYPMEIKSVLTSQTFTVNFVPKSLTRFTASDLGFSGCIPDGVYCFTVTSCGDTYTGYGAIVGTLDCRLDTLISQAKSDDDFKIITKISRYIDSTKIQARLGNVKHSAQMFKIARNELDNLNCEC